MGKVKHGMYGTLTYHSWQAMIQRCNNPKNASYNRYGGRGITVCKEWLSFNNFYKDMGVCPEGMSIDRKDGTKNYTKDNCQWATSKQQSNNKCNNIYLTYKGKTQTIAQWADELGIRRSFIWQRLNDWGWTVEDTLSKPKEDQSPTLLTFNGRTQTIHEWAKEVGIKVETIRSRLNYRGWTVEKALTTPIHRSATSEDGCV